MAFIDLSALPRIDATQPAFELVAHHAVSPTDEQASRQSGGEVRFETVAKTFATATGPLAALDEISFEVGSGEIFGVIGRSGAGKSTLIRLINGLERPSTGRVLVDGIDIGGLPQSGLRSMRRKIGMIFQHFNLLSSRNVEENVALPLRLAGVSRRDALKRASELLDLVGLSDRAKTFPARLSGGQKQRVGIARALVSNPDILLCDEATSALDPETTRSILGLLKDINQRLGITIVLITHEMEVIRDVCDRVAVIETGRIVEIGPVWRVFGDPQSEAARALLRPEDHEGRAGSATTPGTLIEIDFTGSEAHEPDLFAISTALGLPARLLTGSLDRIQGRTQGRLVIALDERDPAVIDAALLRLKTIAPRSRRI